MNVTITPKHALSGTVTAPPSKAQTHRALVAGLLSKGVTKIANPLSCDDTNATAGAIVALGAKLERKERDWIVESEGRPRAPTSEINCGESGVTLRFMIPIASLTGSTIVLRAKQSLMRRPLEPLADAMEQLGVKVKVEDEMVVVEGGPPEGAEVHIRGDISSQFISGLLLAGPLMREGLRLQITSQLESKSYASLTLETLRRHAIEVRTNDEMSVFQISPGQRYRAAGHKIEGDFSSAAFLLTAAAITNSKIMIRGLQEAQMEPDAALLNFLSRMGIGTRMNADELVVEGGRLRAADIDLRDCPDLGPILTVLACCADGESRISGAARLRYKESDRLAAITSELNLLGARISEIDDGLIIHGPFCLNGGTVNSHGDHRIAMALSIAALSAADNVVVEGAECVSKSYPNFFDDLRLLGVEIVG